LIVKSSKIKNGNLLIMRLVLIFGLFFQINCFSQNLIPNGSFESYSKCPTGYSQNKNNDNIRTIEYAYPWRQPSLGTSDLISSCAESPSFSIPRIGYQSGRACAGVLLAGTYYSNQTTATGCVIRNYREFVQTRLTQPLIQNVKYKFSMWVLPNADFKFRSDAIGAYFTSNQISNTTDTLGYNSTIAGMPQVKNPSGNFLTDTSQWTLIQGVFTALGGESYVTIGNFTNDMQTTITGKNGENPELFGCRIPSDPSILPYYFIDNITLLPCGVSQKSDAGIDTSYICFGSNNTVLSPRIVTGQSQYKWSDGSENPNLVVSTPGIYKVAIILKDDCFINDTLIKTYRVLNSDNNHDTTFCLDDFQNYDVRPAFIELIQVFNSPSSNHSIYVQEPGIYYYRPLLHKECINVSLRKLTILSNRNQWLTLNPESFCQRDTILISVSTINSNIQWYFDFEVQKKLIGKSTIELYNTQDRFIGATYVDQFGCDIRINDTVIRQVTIPKIMILPRNIGICKGQQASLTIQTNAYNFQWNDGSKNDTIKASDPGYYKASAWFNEDCKRTDSVLVKNYPNPDFQLSTDTTFCFGNLIPIVLKAPEGYQQYVWNSETTTGNTFSFNQSGIVSFKIIDHNNCATESQINLINNCEDPFLPNVFTPNGDMVNELFEIKNLLPQSELAIFNRWGSKVFTSSSYTNDWKAEGLGDGVYYYQLYNPFYKNQYKGWVEVIR
jgi:gliding motility-associated-like protein